MTSTPVLIAGGGPTGLMLACELRLAGVDVTVLERADGPTGESRAGGIHARTLEVLDQRGLADRFLAIGRKLAAAHFSAIWLDVSSMPTRHPYLLMILQAEIERLLAERLTELGGTVRRGAELTGLTQDADGVTAALADGTTVRAGHLVGCDGGRSTVRKLAGIAFPGTPATMTAMLADVVVDTPPEGRVFQVRTEHGAYSLLDFAPGWWRVMTNEYDRVADRDAPISFEDVRRALTRIAGTDFGIRDPRWVSRFSDAARQAEHYRAGRVLLAGDAAHIHFPAGGQGLNTGVQDAVNLGWKLALVAKGFAPAELLDTYESERHPVGARVLQNTRAQTVLGAPGEQTTALREVMTDLIAIPAANDRLAAMITALDVRYEPGPDAHELSGYRLPDLDLRVGERETSAYELLHAGFPVLLDLGHEDGERFAETARPWLDRLDHVTATGPKTWDVPLVGELDAPSAVLIRPDGHIAWAADPGEPDPAGLHAALERWLGPAE
ncbi:putative monooxygenase [Actinorhabdospora filicis]|uniref:Monooxygenase n=1 Tax=Actinorhabdospora filicis TaxID=1785913 RepID=A0A9W6SNS6_9ACTN|nr:FAD-dependent monooxygenase [Actinorhabdospora filicis]GLZ80275.1 putative monooxygenase [Actinorhabdospora filicis]